MTVSGLDARQEGYARRIIVECRSVADKDSQAVVAAQCAIATGLVESDLKVYANVNNPTSLALPHDAVGSDHGSVGIYQQQVGGARNSTANWGTTAGCMGVESSTHKFLAKLFGLSWANRTPGQLCQLVQGSAYPDRYTERMPQAITVVNALWSSTNTSDDDLIEWVSNLQGAPTNLTYDQFLTAVANKVLTEPVGSAKSNLWTQITQMHETVIEIAAKTKAGR